MVKAKKQSTAALRAKLARTKNRGQKMALKNAIVNRSRSKRAVMMDLKKRARGKLRGPGAISGSSVKGKDGGLLSVGNRYIRRKKGKSRK